MLRALKYFSTNPVTTCLPPQSNQLVEGSIAVVDYALERYSPIVRAYLSKRFITRSQIWPKLYMIEPMVDLQHQFRFQMISQCHWTIPEESLAHQSKNLQITPELMQEKFFQAYFKPLIAQMNKRLLISGATVPFKYREEYKKMQRECEYWFNVYYYGESMSKLEYNIMLKYLVDKQEKRTLYLESNHNLYRCQWTSYDQSCLQRHIGLKGDSSLVDSTRRIFRAVDMKKDSDQQYRILEIQKAGWFNLFKTRWSMRHFKSITKTYLQYTMTYIFSRLCHWIKSKEFLHQMQVPPDFFIELNILTCHVWILVNQIKSTNHPKADFAHRALTDRFKKYTSEKIGLLSIRRKNDFSNQIKNIQNTINCVLYEQFIYDEQKAINPYLRIDALVWSFVYLEKIPRYHPHIYKFSEYLIQNFYHFQQYSFEDLLKADFQFDVFRRHPQFVSKITAINPQLSEQEFKVQENSKKEIKKYHYTYERKLDMVYTQTEFKEKMKVIQQHFRQITLKYGTLNSYDFFSQLEQRRQTLEDTKKGQAWRDESKKEHDFKKLLQIRKQFNEH